MDPAALCSAQVFPGVPLNRRSAGTLLIEETQDFTDHSIALQQSSYVMPPGNCYEARSSSFSKFSTASMARISVPSEKEQRDHEDAACSEMSGRSSATEAASAA